MPPDPLPEPTERGSLRWNMTNHTPSPTSIVAIEKMREQFIQLAERVEDHCPQSRERSLAVTKLEEALMWAVASIARHP